jgi:nitrate reductase beta subunit
MDLGRCLACQSCTVACRMTWTLGPGQETSFWGSVETKPYGSYPVGWDLRLLEHLPVARWEHGVLQTPTIFELDGPLAPPRGHRPRARDLSTASLGQDEVAPPGSEQVPWLLHLPRMCNHCDHPACLAACPRRAIYKRPEDGVVLVDQRRCRGYQECVRACPYKRTFLNRRTRTCEKCNGCFPLLEQGRVSLCVESCPGLARLQGYLRPGDEPRAGNPVEYLVRIRKVALPLYPQLGTGPNVYYLPPRNVPEPFLRQLFGPGVSEARAQLEELPHDPELRAALLLCGATTAPILRYRIGDREVRAWGAQGELVASIPLDLPVLDRQMLDPSRDPPRRNHP